MPLSEHLVNMRLLTVWFLSFVAGVLSLKECSKMADIAFVIDSSSSIHPPNFVTEVNFVYDFLDLFDISPTKTQVAAVSYSTIIKPEFQFNTYKTKSGVLGATQKIVHTKGNSTRTYRAIEYMTDRMFKPENGARSDVIKIAFVMTDGETNPGSDNYQLEEAKKMTLQEAQRARDNGIYIFAIGVGDEVNDEELYGIASDPSAVIKVKTYQEFESRKLKQLLVAKTCEAGTVTTPKPTSKPQEEECTNLVADVIFGIDQSSSIKSKNFGLELDFIVKVVRQFDVGAEETRVGAVVFSSKSETVVKLKDGFVKNDVVQRIQSIPYRGGETYMDKAFRQMREGFSEENGGRPGQVPQIAVLITDGIAADDDKARKEAGKLKSQGVELFTIGVKNASRTQLNSLSSDPDSQYVFNVDSLEALSNIVGSLSSRVCGSRPSRVCSSR